MEVIPVTVNRAMAAVVEHGAARRCEAADADVRRSVPVLAIMRLRRGAGAVAGDADDVRRGGSLLKIVIVPTSGRLSGREADRNVDRVAARELDRVGDSTLGASKSAGAATMLMIKQRAVAAVVDCQHLIGEGAEADAPEIAGICDRGAQRRPIAGVSLKTNGSIEFETGLVAQVQQRLRREVRVALIGHAIRKVGEVRRVVGREDAVEGLTNRHH